MEAFEPLARSGNADAEELIGVMYALGLGVERDSGAGVRLVSALGDEGPRVRSPAWAGITSSASGCPRPTSCGPTFGMASR